MTAGTMARVVSLVDGGQAMVFDEDDITDLIDIALAPTAVASGVQRLLYAEDITATIAAPSSVMVVTVGTEHGAAFLRAGHRAWLTKSAHGPTYAGPGLIYDPTTSSTFPPDAVLPLVRLRRVAYEYLRRGTRPPAYLWQRANDRLPW